MFAQFDLSDRAARWRFVEEFAAEWVEPLQPGDGSHAGDLDAAEGRLEVPLPIALREAYALFGARPDLTSNQDELLVPDDFHLVDDVLVFRVENQGAALWGVELTGEPDPPVLVRPDLADLDAEAWQPWMDRFSMACAEMILAESLHDEELADSRDEEDTDAAALAARYPRIGVPDHPTGQVPPVRWFAGPDVILRNAGGWLSARGRTAEALDAVREDLPGHWFA